MPRPLTAGLALTGAFVALVFVLAELEGVFDNSVGATNRLGVLLVTVAGAVAAGLGYALATEDEDVHARRARARRLRRGGDRAATAAGASAGGARAWQTTTGFSFLHPTDWQKEARSHSPGDSFVAYTGPVTDAGVTLQIDLGAGGEYPNSLKEAVSVAKLDHKARLPGVQDREGGPVEDRARAPIASRAHTSRSPRSARPSASSTFWPRLQSACRQASSCARPTRPSSGSASSAWHARFAGADQPPLEPPRWPCTRRILNRCTIAAVSATSMTTKTANMTKKNSMPTSAEHPGSGVPRLGAA